MGKKNKKQTVGYKYFVGAHLVLCHGPIDRILQIYVDDKLLWTPINDDQGLGIQGSYENVHMDAPGLFGGEDREGGIVGDIEIGMGHPDQGRNGYLTHVLANKLIPAYRGVVSVILKQIYCGTSPYLKPWKFRAQRIWAPTATNIPQWAPEVAGIGDPGGVVAVPQDWDETYPNETFGGPHDSHHRYAYQSRSVIYCVKCSWRHGVMVSINRLADGTSEVKTGSSAYEHRINPLTKDFKVLPDGRILFPLCVAYTGTLNFASQGTWQFAYFYSAILNPETMEVVQKRYPDNDVMELQRSWVCASMTLLSGWQAALGKLSAGCWDDDIKSFFTVLGPDGHSYKLHPEAGTVTQLYNSLPISSSGYVMGFARSNKAKLRTIYVVTVSLVIIDHLERLMMTMTEHLTTTGLEVWSSGTLVNIPWGGLGLERLVNHWRFHPQMTLIPALDGKAHLLLSWQMSWLMCISYYPNKPDPQKYYPTPRMVTFDTLKVQGSSGYFSSAGLVPYATNIGFGLGKGFVEMGQWHAPVQRSDGAIVCAARTQAVYTRDLRPGGGISASDSEDVILYPNGAFGNGATMFRRSGNAYPPTAAVGLFKWHGNVMKIGPMDADRNAQGQWEPYGVLGSCYAGVSPTKTLPAGAYDMNPIHIIRECMTNTEWGRGLPDSIIGPSYAKAAETIYKERLGLSMIWTSEMPINDFILEVIRHIDAVRYEDPETGLQEIKLIRPDYDVATLPVLSPSNCRLEQLTEPTLYDLVNQVTVNFWNRETGEDSAIAAQDTASINMTGTVNNQAMEYSGICSTSVALMVAQRDLARYSKPFRQGRLIVNRKVANLKPGDPFILTWPARGVDRLVCRAALRSDNGELDGQLGIEFGEDIFSQSYNIASVPPPSGWEDPITPPKNFDHVTMFDVPYVMLVDLAGEAEAAATPNDTSYAGFAGARPLTGMHLQYGCFVYPAGTTPPTDSQKEIRESFTPLGITGEDVAQFTDQVITLPLQVANDMGNARVGDWILVGNAADRDREVLCIAEDPGNMPVAIKVTRATADTYPRAIPKGTPLYLVGTFYAYDEIERVSGEAVAGYGAPKNGKGSYPGPFTYLQIDMVGRQGLPYPAAGFQVDGSYQDDLATEKKRVTLTWHHRNRIQQANQALSWLASSDVPLEAGVSYQVRQVALDSAMAVISELPVLPAAQASTLDLVLEDQPYPAAAQFARLSVEAVKGGRVSLQNRPITVKLAPRLYAPTGLKAEYVGVPGLVAPSALQTIFDSGAPVLRAPADLQAAYVGPDKLLAPDHLVASYTGPDKLVAPDHLVASYTGPAKLLAPDHLIAQYVGQAKLVAPVNLVAEYRGTPILQRPSGLQAAFVPGMVPLAAPDSLEAVYTGPDKLLAPDHLVAVYTGPDKLLAPDHLVAVYTGPAKLLAPDSLVAVYTGPAKLLAPDSLVVSYRGTPVLQRPGDLSTVYFSGVYRLQAPVGLSTSYH